MRWEIPTLALGIVFVLAGAEPALAQKKAPDGAKVLILSGGQRQHHGYREQALYLSQALEDTGQVEATICEDAAILETPAMAKYGVLVVLSDRRDPEFKFTPAQQQALLSFVKGGKGYVSIHGADNAAPDWVPEWREMLGGVFSHVGLPDSKTRKGEYAVEITGTAHPITKGASNFQLKDELYYHLQMKTPIEPLAVIQLNGETWPVAWAKDYGKGKVFHTVFGHRDFGPDKPDPLRNPDFGRLVVRGTLWAAGKLEP